MTELINTLTERLDRYQEAITDCCGDHMLYGELSGRIDELEFVLDLLCPKDTSEMNRSRYKDLLKNYQKRKEDA